MKRDFPIQIFEKYSNIKFDDNPSNGSQDRETRQTFRHTDMIKLMVTFQNFANMPDKKGERTIFFYSVISVNNCKSNPSEKLSP
jgi:hypothetical protein